MHLYIGGKYVGSYNTINDLGFTTSQVKHAFNRSKGYYHSSSDILFTRELINSAPK